MGFSYTFAVTTAAHQHTALASDGGILSLSVTRVGGFSPISLVMALG